MRSTRQQERLESAADAATLAFADACLPGRLSATLAEHGFALVQSVEDEPTCASLVDDLKAFLSSLGYLCGFGDPAAEADDSCWPLGCKGLFDGFGAGHYEAAWKARLHPRVREVFAALHGTQKLVSSIGAVCAERPAQAPRSDEASFCLHTDQNPYSEKGGGFDCVQGALSLTATCERGGGTTLVPGSHLLHKQLLTQPPTGPTPELAARHLLNWHELTPAQDRWLLQTKQLPVVHITTQPGDLLLWDSRTIHAGRAARSPGTGWRFATYICMWPASRLSDEARKRKRRAMGLDGAVRAEATTHWPDGRELKPRYGWPERGSDEDPWKRATPPGANEGICKPPDIALSQEGLRLAGAEPYSDSD